jgi:dTDP-4-dehydrorhamnose reductase
METIFMAKHVLITGSNGQLGQELKALVSKQTDKDHDAQFFFTDRDSLDITDKNALTAFIETKNINTINKKKIVNTYDLKIPYWKDSLKSCIALLNS